MERHYARGRRRLVADYELPSAENPVGVLERLAYQRGTPPAKTRVNNGPEFISRVLDHWAY